MTTSYENVCAFLYQEARLLDDREWDAWIEMYDPQAEFWMPAWADDGELTTNPQTEISLFYYPSRGGLEDRVFRIRTELAGHDDIGRQNNRDTTLGSLGHVLSDGVDLVFFEKAGTNVVALGLEEGEDHAATNEDRVDTRQ